MKKCPKCKMKSQAPRMAKTEGQTPPRAEQQTRALCHPAVPPRGPARQTHTLACALTCALERPGQHHHGPGWTERNTHRAQTCQSRRAALTQR